MKSFNKFMLGVAMFFMAVALSTLSSCEDTHITDNDGTVVKVVRLDNEVHDHSKQYCVKVEIRSDEITYYLFTDQKFTVGDIISFKR